MNYFKMNYALTLYIYFDRCMCQMESGPLVALIRKLMILMRAGTFFLHEQGGNTLTGQHSAVMKKLCKLFPFCSLSKKVVNNRRIFSFLACFRINFVY